MEAVGEGVLTLCLQRILGTPKTSDVVVNFLLGRDFDQLDRSLSPIADWFGPQAWPLLKIGFKIFILEKISFPLHLAEAVRIEIGESADLQVAGIAQWAP